MIRKRTTLTTNEKKQRLFLLLFTVVLLGAGGSVLMLLQQHFECPIQWMGVMGMFFQTKTGLSALCAEALCGAVVFLSGLFLLGFSAVGQPAALLLLLAYGVCMGSALQTQCIGTQAVLRSFCLMPYFVPVSVLMVIAARESMRFSALFTAYGFRDEPAEQMCHRFRMYCARFLVLLLFLLLTAVLYSLIFYALQ